MKERTFNFKLIATGLIIGLVLGASFGYLGALESLYTTLSIYDSVKEMQKQLVLKDDQIRNLQAQLQEIQLITGPIRRGSWNTVATFQGTRNTISDYFYAGGNELRINWTWRSNEIVKWQNLYNQYLKDFGPDSAYTQDALDNLKRAEKLAVLGIILYRKGESYATKVLSYLEKNGSIYIHDVVTSYYYLDVVTAYLDQWNITVEVWIPS